MADYFGEFNNKSGAALEASQRLDFEDLQREIAGIEVGRIPRFLSKDARDAIAERTGKAGSGSRSAISALDYLLLIDPEYAQMHQAALDENRAGQAAVTDLQDRIAHVMAKIDDKIAETLDQAVTLPDGRKAFLHEDGSVYSSDGELVDPAIAEGYDWEGRPSYDAYLSLTRDKARLEQLAKENDAIGLRLGEIADRLEDEDTPPSKKELDAIQAQQEADIKRVKEIDAEVQEVERQMTNDPAAPSIDQDTAISSAPKVDSLNF